MPDGEDVLALVAVAAGAGSIACHLIDYGDVIKNTAPFDWVKTTTGIPNPFSASGSTPLWLAITLASGATLVGIGIHRHRHVFTAIGAVFIVYALLRWGAVGPSPLP